MRRTEANTSTAGMDAAAKRNQSAGESNEPSDRGGTRLERISRRAFEIYQARGGLHGRSLDDWLAAEREIDGEAPE